MRAVSRLRQSTKSTLEAGFTLVELLVTMVIIGVVSLLVVTAMTQAASTFLIAKDESQGLGDAKTVLDQISRDIRESRGVVCDGTGVDPNCEAHLQLWVDSDSDYAEDSSEVITWELQDSGDGVHFDVWRLTGDGDAKLVASSLIVQTLFEYDSVDPEEAELVTVTMQYDANVGTGIDVRTATTSARVRNR